MKRNNDIFDCVIDIRVKGQGAKPAWEQKMLAKALEGGVNNSEGAQSLRKTCRIAEDMNAALADGIVVGDRLYGLNPRNKSQFGRNREGDPFLTTGVVDAETGQRLTLTWSGVNVPLRMVEAAVKHDAGKRIGERVVPLDFGMAVVHETGNKDGNGRAKRDGRRNHDTDKNGKPYPRKPRPNHNRLCATDIKRLQANLTATSK